MNNFHQDSLIFFRELSKRIKDKIEDIEVIQLAFNLALGCERLLKGILYDINPTYIYIEPGFKHTVQVIYSSRIVIGAPSNELAQKPNRDVITFNNSLLRVQTVSETALNHKNILFAISNARDIIAHCELRLLDIKNLREMIQRDFYPMLKSFANELDIKKESYFGGNSLKLSRISSSLQTDLQAKIELLLETHNQKWHVLKGNENYVFDKDKATAQVLSFQFKEKIPCPACNNNSVIYYKPIMEYDNTKLEEIIIGTEAKKLKCQYCKLEITDPAILDYFGIKGQKINPPETCASCGKELPFYSSGICEDCEDHYGLDG